MSKLNSGADVAAQGLFEISSTQLHDLGEVIRTSDGRTFRYAKAGAVDLVAGKLNQAAAEITNHQDLTPSAAAIGATQVTVTLGATAATANYYAGGYLIVTTSAGVGNIYLIKSHPAASSSGSLTITLDEPIAVALTTSSRIDLVPNPLSAVVVNPTSATSAPVGVNNIAVTAGYYFWLQTGGVTSVLAKGALVVGTQVFASDTTAGAVEPIAGVTAGTQANVGLAVAGTADGQNGAVKLLLD